MTDGEVQQVLDSINALGETGSAAERARRLTELLDEWPKKHAEIRAMRQQAVMELRESGMTYRKIGELLDISFSRVRHIAEGITNPRIQKKASDSSAE